MATAPPDSNPCFREILENNLGIRLPTFYWTSQWPEEPDVPTCEESNGRAVAGGRGQEEALPLLAAAGCGAGRGEGDRGVRALDAELGDEVQVAAVPVVGEVGEHGVVSGRHPGRWRGGERGEDGEDGKIDGRMEKVTGVG
uniref:OSJNBa0029H02.14 protein n=2 Tax=Oryza TaxID=4527 RepID=Q7XT76_ORYSJ|nr:OSJNBa0029H02.14 [Oryza sativa Japonica Group]